MKRSWWGVLVLGGFGAVGVGAPADVSGQGLADYDYENLSFRGISLETGRLWPNNVTPGYLVGVRLDLGFLGPSFRLMPHVSYWEESLEPDEVRSFERRLQAITGVEDPIDLGAIEWSDLEIGLDGHFVWSIPGNLLSYAGFGATAHIMNGSGEFIQDTFVEDLLDRVALGFNVHLGLEYPIIDEFRVYLNPRYEILDDLRMAQLRVGAKYLFGTPAPGEVRRD